MSTKKITRKQLSALLDSELPEQQWDLALAALRDPDELAHWELYHQIGDALRSDDLAVPMHPDFMERFAERLEKEPTILAPAAQSRPTKYFMQGMAAAAVAAIAFFAMPSFMEIIKKEWISPLGAVLASYGSTVSSPTARVRPENEILRDPGIDEYLLAHQRFSPSVYSTAQYARSATFAVDSDK